MDQEKQPAEDQEQEESEQEEDDQRQKRDWHQQLLKACQKGDMAYVKKCLDRKANIFAEDKKKWNSLMWSACKGYISIVRLLLSRGAGQPYAQDLSVSYNFAQTMAMSPVGQGPATTPFYSQYSPSPGGKGENFNLSTLNKKVTMGVINQQNKSTPLQWACFKGHLQIVWLLLRAGLSWEDVDQFGNNSVQLAASGGSLLVFQTLLYFGVAVDRQNTRGHTALDLATNLQIIGLIKQLMASPTEQHHFCMTCKQFHKVDNYRLDWVYEDAESTEMEKPEGRCHQCWKLIQSTTEELIELIDQQDHKLLSEKLLVIETNKVEVDPKTMKRALYEQEKLRTQNVILDYLHNLRHVPNYKTILKSVNQVRLMLQDAVDREVVLDDKVKEIANHEMERLVSERNLQFCLDNMDAGQAIPENVEELNDKVQSAEQKGVAIEYITEASQLRDKMAKAIQAKTLLKMFTEYPIREIPDPIKIDFKTKKPIDPISGKPIDPLKLAVQNQTLMKKMKKKKDNKFTIPEWANEVKTLDDSIKTLESLLKESEVLNLSKEFVDESVGQIKRMKNEMRYRKQIDDEIKLIADAKAAEKKKNK